MSDRQSLRTSGGPALTVYIESLRDVTRDAVDLVGGKGANLGELLGAGFPVPDGFCVNTRAFRRFVQGCGALEEHYASLERLRADDRATVEQVGARLRAELDGLAMPDDVCAALVAAWRDAGDGLSYAVRSSATAEDLAEASFAGQHDTYLNVRGEQQLVNSVRNCWMSLFSARAIAYRARLGTDHRLVDIAVVVQRMVVPQVSGVMFTADPLSGSRRVTVINAAYGLGEAVVSGVVNPDLYRVEKDGTLAKSVFDKTTAINPDPSGGVAHEDVADSQRKAQALPDEAIVELAALGRRIEAHFGASQDIEWARADTGLHVLQSRPITSLYPTPDTPKDGRLHVYFSFGHQQAMTDAIKPLGLSLLRTYFPFGSRLPNGESTQMVVAGNRLYFDYTDPLHTRLGRAVLARAAGAMDRRVGGAIRDVARRPDFYQHHRFSLPRSVAINAVMARSLAAVVAELGWVNMDTRRARAEEWIRRTLATSRAAVDQAQGAERIAGVQQDLKTVPTEIFSHLTVTQLAALIARGLVQGLCRRWTGHPADIAALDKSLPGNVTVEMGMAMGDLADLAREKPALLGFLQSPPKPLALSVLDSLPEGVAFAKALHAFLVRYGARCPGEIDITRERWIDDPTQLFSAIVANTRSGAAGEHRDRFAAGERAAAQATTRMLDTIRATPFGAVKAPVMARMIEVYRTLMGLREHPKFFSVQLFDIYRKAIFAEVQALTDAGILAASDAHYLSLEEVRRLLAGKIPADLAETIEERKQSHKACETLRPPRLFLSDGEVVNGTAAGLDREGVLVGSPVSAGVAEGRARVVLRPQDAEIADGDILVAPFTDPAWTPLFAAVRGMVLEVGGLMTHGSVIARELGVPAVVGVDDATRRIPDGQYIRIDGSQGIVEFIREPERASTRGGGHRP